MVKCGIGCDRQGGERFDSTNLLAGLDFQREIEKNAFDLSKKYASGKEVPAQTIEQFLGNKNSNIKNQKHSCPQEFFSQDARSSSRVYHQRIEVCIV